MTSWVLSTKSGPGRQASVRSADEPIPASAGFIRFCSAFMAGPAEGFSTYTFFTGEERHLRRLSKILALESGLKSSS